MENSKLPVSIDRSSQSVPKLTTQPPQRINYRPSLDGRPLDSPHMAPLTDNIKYSDLKFISKCGQGVYGTVYEGLYQNKRVAIKNMNVSPTQYPSEKKRQRLLNDFRKEARLLQSLQHSNIIKYYGISSTNVGLSIVTEFLDGGTLYDLIQFRPFCLTPYNICSIAIDIAEGCKYLHECAVLHRDLKSQNVMLSKDGSAKVVDFGLSRIYSAEFMTGSRGTPAYMSPELWDRGHIVYDYRIDVYSFGIMLWEMCSKVFPWSTGPLETIVSCAAIQKAIFTGHHLPFTPEMHSKFGLFIPLIKRCWEYKTRLRPVFQEVISILQNDIMPKIPKPKLSPGYRLEFFDKPPITPSKKIVKDEESPYLPEIIKKLLGKHNVPTQRLKYSGPPPLELAKNFWQTSFGHQDAIPARTFYKTFLSHSVAHIARNESQVIPWIKERLTPSNIYFLMWCAIDRLKTNNYKPTGTDTVSVESFTNFLSCWDGHRPPLVNALNIFSRRFFYGCLSWPETLEIFEGQSIGSFLMRLSYKSPHLIGIAFVERKGQKIIVSQSLKDMNDIGRSWDKFLTKTHKLKMPIKFPRSNSFPGFYDDLVSFWPSDVPTESPANPNINPIPELADPTNSSILSTDSTSQKP